MQEAVTSPLWRHLPRESSAGSWNPCEGRADGWFLLPEWHRFRSAEWDLREPETWHHLRIIIPSIRSKRNYSNLTQIIEANEIEEIVLTSRRTNARWVQNPKVAVNFQP